MAITKEKKTGLLFLLGAGLLIVVAMLTAYFGISTLTKEEPILIANAEIKAGDPLTTDHFKLIKVPVGGIPSDAIRPDTNITGHIAVKDMNENEILRFPNVIDLENPNIPMLSSRLRALYTDDVLAETDDEELRNFRAAEIPIASITGMIDGMETGDRLAVISVFEDPETGEERAETIFDYVDVLQLKKPSEDNPGALILALTQKQTEALALARENGSFSVSLMAYGIEKPEGHPEVLSETYINRMEGEQSEDPLEPPTLNIPEDEEISEEEIDEDDNE